MGLQPHHDDNVIPFPKPKLSRNTCRVNRNGQRCIKEVGHVGKGDRWHENADGKRW